jgi:hypothetical protein
MADEYKKKIADFYRVEYALPVDKSDDDIIDFAKNDNPSAFDEVMKGAYGHPPTPVDPPSLLERGINKVNSVMTEGNKNTEEWANRSFTADPVEDVAILGNKGLKKFTDMIKPFGESVDSISSKVSGVSDLLGKLAPDAKPVINAFSAPVSDSLALVSQLIPRTPMQSAFALLTLPFTEIEGAGNSITSAGKRLVGGASEYAAKTPFGSILSPAERFPESKLAGTLENLLKGTEGEDKFILGNKSEMNREVRNIKSLELGTAETALGNKEEGFIAERKKYDIENAISSQNGELADAAKTRDLEKSGIDSALSDKSAELDALARKEKGLVSEGLRMESLRRAKSRAVSADLAVDDAIGLAAQSRRGIQVGRGLEEAQLAAQKGIQSTYNSANGIADTVHVDLSSFKEKMGEQLKGLTDELALLSTKDKRAAKILSVLQDAASETATPESMRGAEILGGSSSKLLQASAEELKSRKPATLENLFNAYKDLNDLHRKSGEQVYSDAKDALLQTIRSVEDGNNILKTGADQKEAQFAINLWDSAREARMHLDAAFEHESLQNILKVVKSKEPERVFGMLTGKESGMTLERFMQVAPQSAKDVVRRESLRQGVDVIQKAAPGKAAQALDAWISDLGAGNVKLLHPGNDTGNLLAIASANDALHEVGKEYPVLRKQINDTMSAVSDLLDKNAKSATKAAEQATKAKESGWELVGKIEDKARKETLARREETAKRIADGIDAINKTFDVRTKLNTRASGAGEVLPMMSRGSDDRVSTPAIAGGASVLAAVGIAEKMGLHVPGSGVARGGAVFSIITGLVIKSPKAFSNLYYSPMGRQLVERAASAPTAKDAALALMELADAVKNPLAYLALKKNAKDVSVSRPQMGRLSGLQGDRTPLPLPSSVQPATQESDDNSGIDLNNRNNWQR